MKDEHKTKEQLIGELAELRRQVAELQERIQEESVLREVGIRYQTQREAEVSALLESAGSILRYQGFDDRALAIFNSCKELVGATVGHITLVDENSQSYEVPFIELEGRTCSAGLALPAPVQGIHAEVFKTGKTIYRNNFAGSEWQKLLPEGHIGIDNVLYAPLIIGGEVVGLLGLGNKPGGFTENDARLVSAFSGLAAVALFNSRTLESLKYSEDRFYKAFHASPNPMAICTLEDGHFIEVNDSFINGIGYTREEVIGRTPNELNIWVSEEDYEAIVQTLYDQGNLSNFEAYIRTKSGSLRFGLISADITDLGGVQCVMTSFNDITERKRMEEALQSSERFLSNIFESIQDRLTVIDRDFNIIRVNAKVEQSFPDLQPLIGRKCYSVFENQDNSCAFCTSRQALETGQPANALVPVKRRDGEVAGWLEYYSYPFIDTATGEVQGVIIYARDITEKIKVEQEMARLDRLNLVGEMAATIGHEVRNPMTTVRGFLQILESKGECENYREYFGIMINELDRANSIITEYLSLAKNRPADQEKRNLNSIIKALTPLIEADAVNSGLDVATELGDIPDLLLNEKDIRQLILNLVRNGLEAMQAGGCLTIKTFTEGDEVVLLVQDQGKGINPEFIDKVGTPFFTTKENGTGLGLAVCYSVAARHSATIKPDSSPRGTAFFVRFRRQRG